MNSRSYCILKDLMESDHHSLSSFSQRYQVSERTIRNDIKRINGFISDKEKAVRILKTGEIILILNRKKRETVLSSIDFYIYKLAQPERMILIAYYLIMKDDVVKVDELTKILSVSRSTINSDLEKVKQILLKSGLNISAYSNRGLFVYGHELKKRLLATQLRSLSNRIILDFLMMIDHKYLIHQEKKRRIRKRISEVLKSNYDELRLDLNEKEHQILLDYCELMIRRYRESSDDDPRDRSHVVLPDSETILTGICSEFKLKQTKTEKIYLSQFLYQALKINTQNRSSKMVQISELLREFIDQTSLDLEVDLSRDFCFYEKLWDSINSMVFTVKEKVHNEDKFDHSDGSVFYSKLISKKQSDLIKKLLDRKPTDKELQRIGRLIDEAKERRSIKDLIDNRYRLKKNVESRQIIDQIYSLIKTSKNTVNILEDTKEIIENYIRQQSEIYSGLSAGLRKADIKLDLNLEELALPDHIIVKSDSGREASILTDRDRDHSLKNFKSYRIVSNAFLLLESNRRSCFSEHPCFLVRLKETLELKSGESIKWIGCLEGLNEPVTLKSIFTLEKLLEDRFFRERIDKACNSEELQRIIQEFEVFTCSCDFYGL